MKKFVIQKIEAPQIMMGEVAKRDLEKRLCDLGFYPGLEVEVVAKISFKSVTIIQYGATRLALNQEEFACLRGH